MVNTQIPYDVRINHIAIDPDRFGRLHPVVFFSATPHHGQIVQQAHLKSLQDLKQRNYAVGDLIELHFVGSHPILGKILVPAKPTDRRLVSTEPLLCKSCHLKLFYHNGQPYCPDYNCPWSVYARTLYATQPHVLDLPFGSETLNYLIWGQEYLTDFPSMLFLEPKTAFEGILGDHEIEIITDALKRRLDQLFGRGFSPEVQNLAQYRFLDAFSIPGLHRTNLKRLRAGLRQAQWVWNDLPHVLTDVTMLRSLGISKSYVVTILKYASERIMELDALSRET